MQMSNKRNVVLYLDKELVEKTRNLGFNLSKTFENYLKHLLTQFPPVYTLNNFNSTDKNSDWWAGPDLNRRPLARKANVLTKLDDRPFSDLDKVCFIKVWSLENKYKAVTSYTAESKIVTRKTQRTIRRKVVSER
jgi:hypothetical protein